MDWEELYLEYSDRVHNYIYLMVRNRDVAEDLTHDTFLKVKNSLGRFRGEANYYTWIISIARNVTYDYFRRKRLVQFTPMLPFNHPTDSVTPDDILFDNESVQELYKTIKKLKKNYQDVIILRYIQEFSIEETAAILNCSIAKVKSTTFRAVKQLREELHNKEGDYIG
ncbi:RNA polymerase sigma factor [Ornithinibacillus californiensis]|uniref:RNA polymerase sigma factor n=1 Tax=Ornithinibacillus californiensis TaxID=161536 RepID=UPI00064DB60F|nr:RNA polymerase sigma factor [Ornithinibacillus californiensis]